MEPSGCLDMAKERWAATSPWSAPDPSALTERKASSGAHTAGAAGDTSSSTFTSATGTFAAPAALITAAWAAAGDPATPASLTATPAPWSVALVRSSQLHEMPFKAPSTARLATSARGAPPAAGVAAAPAVGEAGPCPFGRARKTITPTTSSAAAAPPPMIRAIGGLPPAAAARGLAAGAGALTGLSAGLAEGAQTVLAAGAAGADGFGASAGASSAAMTSSIERSRWAGSGFSIRSSTGRTPGGIGDRSGPARRLSMASTRVAPMSTSRPTAAARTTRPRL